MRHFMGAGLICGGIGLAIGGLDQFVGEEIGFHFFSANVREHVTIDDHAGAEHLAAFFDHFLPLHGIVNDVAILEWQVIFAHDGADALAPAAGWFEISNNVWFIHRSKFGLKMP